MELLILFNCGEFEFNSHMWPVAAILENTVLENKELLWLSYGRF